MVAVSHVFSELIHCIFTVIEFGELCRVNPGVNMKIAEGIRKINTSI